MVQLRVPGEQCTHSCSSTTTTTELAMATSKVILSRLSCRLKLLSHTKLPKQPPPSSSSSSLSPPSAPRIIISRTSRVPVELGGVGSMMPFHSAVASARLVSSLCIESQGWCLVPQGISMPL